MAQAEQRGYTFLDYIENPGDPDTWIELPTIPTSTWGYRAIVSHSQLGAAYVLWGTQEDANKRITLNGNASKKNYIGIGSANTTATSSPDVDWNIPFVSQFNYKNNGKAHINGTQVSNAATINWTPTWKFVVLGRRRYSDGYNGVNNITQRMYEFVETTGSSVTRYWKPCRSPGGAVGLLDILNDVFVGNSGTGTLVGGRELYIGENTVSGAAELLAVAASYLNQNSIAYDDGQTPIYYTTATTGIDCSTFVILCLLGLSYADSPYSTGNYGPWKQALNIEDYDWATNPLLYTISRYTDDTNPDEMVRLACQVGRWLNGRCKVVPLTEDFSGAQPGDVVFYAYKSRTTEDWRNPTYWMHISHVAIVYSVEDAPDNYSYTVDGETVTIPWDKSRFPLKHTVIEATARTPPCTTARYLEIDQEDQTNVYRANCNTVCLILRPNFS